MVSQVVKAKTFEKASGVLSIATGVLVQMNQKIGLPVWKINRNHIEFTQENYETFSVVKKKSKVVKKKRPEKKIVEKKPVLSISDDFISQLQSSDDS